MCEVTTALLIGGTLVKVAGDVTRHIGEKKEAQQNQRNALTALQLSLEDIRARGAEETLAAAESIRDTRRHARAVAATAAASAGEAGVAGISVDLLLGDIERQSGERVGSIEANRDIALRQLEREARGQRAQAISRIQGSPEPSFLTTGLSIGSTLLGTAAASKSRKIATQRGLGG